MDLKEYFARVDDFPKQGIVFRDFSPLLASPEAFEESISQLQVRGEKYDPAYILGIESRGFPFGSALALRMKLPFVMVRKAGKLPPPVAVHTYDLEYGQDTLEIKKGLIKPGSRVVLVDDVLASGGTAVAAATLAQQVGADPVALLCALEISALKGRQRVEEVMDVETLISFS